MKTPTPSSARPENAVISLPLRLRRPLRLWAALGCAVLAFFAQRAEAAVTEGWVQRYDGPANLDDTPSMVAVDGSGNVVVTGSSYDGTNSDSYTAKYAAASGTMLWEKRGILSGGTLDSNGNIVSAGSSNSGTGSTIYVAKYAAADGALLWEKHYTGPSNTYTFVAAVAVDGSGNIALTGGSGLGNPVFGSETTYTAKYAGVDGSLLWEKKSNGTRSAVAFDISANVVVAGSSWNGANHDFYTAKYAATNGALLWERRYNGPANGNDFAYGMAVDANGNVAATGLSATSTSADSYTAKYAATNGALFWEKRYNGPANGYDGGKSVAVDAIGNVVVTVNSDGSSQPNNNPDFYTAKYAAANGALLWEHRYDGLANSVDAPFAVAVDGKGNPVVMGLSRNIAGNLDLYTAKYAAADGALLWEKRYDGPGFGDDRPWTANCLALGPNGMVAITGSSVGTFGNQDFATVVYWENLPTVSIAMVPSGTRLRFTGAPGSSYNIERAPAARGPWSTIATPAAPLDGLIEYVDTNPPTGAAFYRTSTQ